MARFSEHFANQRNEEANKPEPKQTNKEREDNENRNQMAREANVNKKLRRLLRN